MDDLRQQIDIMRARIARDEDILHTLEYEVRDIQTELSLFKARYDLMVQPLVERLKTVREAISALEHRRAGAEPLTMPGPDYVDDIPLDAPEVPPLDPPPQAAPSRDIKALYRRLARQYHPDHAATPGEADYRTRVMAKINAAYAARDLETLQALDVQDHIAAPDESLDVLLLRELQHRHQSIRQQIIHLKSQYHALLHCDLMRLKTETSLNRNKGRDLLREIAAQLERDYRMALRQLYDLRHTVDQAP